MNLNLLGIDFEEWYHPQLVKPFVNHMKHEPKIIKGIEKIIDLLQKNETSATFFMVGELLEHKPDILDLLPSDKPCDIPQLIYLILEKKNISLRCQYYKVFPK